MVLHVTVQSMNLVASLPQHIVQAVSSTREWFAFELGGAWSSQVLREFWNVDIVYLLVIHFYVIAVFHFYKAHQKRFLFDWILHSLDISGRTVSAFGDRR